MASHPRAMIRKAVAAQLAGKTSAGARVEATRQLAYRERELPGIAVYTVEESIADESVVTAPRELTRELQLEIAGWVAAGPRADDAMDELAQQVEVAMDADRYLGGTAADSYLVSTTLGLSPEGDVLLGLVTLTYAVVYRTLAPAAPTGLDDFNVAGVTHNLGGVVGEDDLVSDEVVVQGA